MSNCKTTLNSVGLNKSYGHKRSQEQAAGKWRRLSERLLVIVTIAITSTLLLVQVATADVIVLAEESGGNVVFSWGLGDSIDSSAGLFSQDLQHTATFTRVPTTGAVVDSYIGLDECGGMGCFGSSLGAVSTGPWTYWSSNSNGINWLPTAIGPHGYFVGSSSGSVFGFKLNTLALPENYVFGTDFLPGDVTISGQTFGSMGIDSSSDIALFALPSGDTISLTFDATVVPEPSTALLLGLGLTGLAAKGRRRNRS